MCCHHFLSEEQVRKLSLQGTLQVYWVESLPRWVCILYAGSGIFRAVQDTHGWDPEALKSQDHRIIEVGRDPLRSSSPTLLLKAGSTWKVAQDHTSQDGDSIMFWATCASVGQPSQRKKCSIAYKWSFSEFQFVPVASCPVAGHCWGESDSVSSTTSSEILVCIGKILLNFSGWRVLAFSIIALMCLVTPFSRRALKRQTMHSLSTQKQCS